jgi:hypothetical protein
MSKVYVSVHASPAVYWMLRKIFGDRLCLYGKPPMTSEEGGYFGVCPECLRHDGYINCGPNRWFLSLASQRSDLPRTCDLTAN